ncbi:MAG: VPLPA-CTERM sorting domain-containing protein [Pseudomonadota bacterium]
MRSIVAVAVVATALFSAPKALALAQFGAAGEVWLEIESDPDIEVTVDYVINDGLSQVLVAGNAAALTTDELASGVVGVVGIATGAADAPGGEALVDFILDVTFTIENTSGIPGAAPGQDQFFEGSVLYDIIGEASISLPDEEADAFALVVGGLNLPGAPSDFVFVTEMEGVLDSAGVLAFVGGSLAPGESISYGATIDVGGLAFSPISPPPGAEVPLPAAGLLMLSGLGALVAARRRRQS